MREDNGLCRAGSDGPNVDLRIGSHPHLWGLLSPLLSSGIATVGIEAPCPSFTVHFSTLPIPSASTQSSYSDSLPCPLATVI